MLGSTGSSGSYNDYSSPLYWMVWETGINENVLWTPYAVYDELQYNQTAFNCVSVCPYIDPTVDSTATAPDTMYASCSNGNIALLEQYYFANTPAWEWQFAGYIEPGYGANYGPIIAMAGSNPPSQPVTVIAFRSAGGIDVLQESNISGEVFWTITPWNTTAVPNTTVYISAACSGDQIFAVRADSGIDMFDLTNYLADPWDVAPVRIASAKYSLVTADPTQGDVIYALRTGATVFPPSIGDLRTLPDGTSVDLCGYYVTAALSGFFYVEDLTTNGSTTILYGPGIKIVNSAQVYVDDRVGAVGTLLTDSNGERYISATSCQTLSSDNPPIVPIGVVGKELTPNTGATTIGRLIKIGGNLSETAGSWYINDGSNSTGIQVIPNGVSLSSGFAIIVGVAGMQSGEPVIYLRTSADYMPVVL